MQKITVSLCSKLLTNCFELLSRHWLWFTQFIRPPDIHVDGLIFYHRFFFLSSFFFFIRPLISELAERNSTISGHMVGSKCDLKMHVWNVGIPSCSKSGPQNTFFRRLRNLTATSTAYIFGTKHDRPIHNRTSGLETTRNLLHRLRML